ncbi:MAG: prepilin-type N-terminal cleavage/methylation domain-containing protein [Desulfobacterales bacterium]
MHSNKLVRLRLSADMSGFTFVELLVVLAIFTIAVLAVAAMQITSINTNASARMSGEASALAANQLEALMALPYDHSDLIPATAYEVVSGPYTVRWEVTLADMDGNGTDDSKAIEVAVQCANRNAKVVSIQYIKPEV